MLAGNKLASSCADFLERKKNLKNPAFIDLEEGSRKG